MQARFASVGGFGAEIRLGQGVVLLELRDALVDLVDGLQLLGEAVHLGLQDLHEFDGLGLLARDLGAAGKCAVALRLKLADAAVDLGEADRLLLG